MNCDEVEDRLLDEDSRAALLGRTSLPADLAAHVEGCPACAAILAEHEADTRQLRAALLVEPPPRIRARVLGQLLSPPPPDFPWSLASAAASVGALAAALTAALLGGSTSDQCLAFAAVSSLAFALLVCRSVCARVRVFRSLGSLAAFRALR